MDKYEISYKISDIEERLRSLENSHNTYKPIILKNSAELEELQNTGPLLQTKLETQQQEYLKLKTLITTKLAYIAGITTAAILFTNIILKLLK